MNTQSVNISGMIMLARIRGQFAAGATLDSIRHHRSSFWKMIIRAVMIHFPPFYDRSSILPSLSRGMSEFGMERFDSGKNVSWSRGTE